ncbi:hypothetical protein CVT26_013191 [Gymnopilus dilepis]|uniref:Uncharacterized protein n=1 Tax=Gymnopilus dilepis TaxID=231916 RepID=A0A409VWD9_9AGAR|nr:hypothetical protein CVT26_013191 [Gymnopilus dilepis]
MPDRPSRQGKAEMRSTPKFKWQPHSQRNSNETSQGKEEKTKRNDNRNSRTQPKRHINAAVQARGSATCPKTTQQKFVTYHAKAKAKALKSTKKNE